MPSNWWTSDISQLTCPAADSSIRSTLDPIRSVRAAIVRMASTRASPDADGVAVTGPLAPPSVTPAMAEEEEAAKAVEEGEVDVEAEAEVVVRHLVVLVADRGPVVPARIPRAINFRTERTAAWCAPVDLAAVANPVAHPATPAAEHVRLVDSGLHCLRLIGFLSYFFLFFFWAKLIVKQEQLWLALWVYYYGLGLKITRCFTLQSLAKIPCNGMPTHDCLLVMENKVVARDKCMYIPYIKRGHCGCGNPGQNPVWRGVGRREVERRSAPLNAITA